MTIVPFLRRAFSLRRRTGNDAERAPQNNTCDNLRREYVSEMLASGACISEFGAAALLSLFPKDF